MYIREEEEEEEKTSNRIICKLSRRDTTTRINRLLG